MTAPVPANESSRLRLLYRHQILDTPYEDAFDDVTRLASTICETPMASITLIDAGRQWFKSAVGLPNRETPRDQAFCAHAILEDDVMVVEDATTDQRFAGNPFVTGNPGIRFYAGAPLTMPEGLTLGTLCVVDRTPRRLTEAQLDALRVLRRAVVTQLDLRRALRDLSDVERLLPICAWCRDVRNSAGEWSPLYEYAMKSGQVTHGMCPECSKDFEADR